MKTPRGWTNCNTVDEFDLTPMPKTWAFLPLSLSQRDNELWQPVGDLARSKVDKKGDGTMCDSAFLGTIGLPNRFPSSRLQVDKDSTFQKRKAVALCHELRHVT